MAWKKGYYYRSRWHDGTCQSEYIGTGDFAELIAALDEQERLQRTAAQEEFRRMVAEDTALQRDIDAIGKVCANVVTATLIIAGYHRHKRQWRKEKGMESIQVTTQVEANITAEKVTALVEAVDSGKPTNEQRAELACYFDQFPKLAKLQGDANEHITTRLIQSLHGSGSEAGEMAVLTHLRNIKAGMGYKGAPIAEQMLIDHICICWLRLQLAEWRHLNHTTEGHDMKDGAYWENVLNAAQKRYLRAVESLARVRSLNVKIQINMANQQIVAG